MIDSSFYNIFAVKYPQIYKTIRNHIINNKIDNRKKIQQFVETINSILNDIRYLIKIIDSNKRLYPSTVIDYETIKKSNLFKDSMNSLKKIIKNNDGDRKSLSLCNQFLTVNLKHNDKLTFITVDKDDFIKHGNKSNIETIIKGLIIEILPQLDVENIILKYD
ncbi:hypothetical protein KY347_01245 [Candidatus Woesearchaeota archaeon]|nr:hypothetical protein [Candidatus Woesearchaeota archaeon]